MARLTGTDGVGEIAEQIRVRRSGRLRPIDEMLLHSPPVADGWNALLGAIRQRMGLAADLRELVILRVAVLNDAPYEWASHEAVARSVGLDDELLDAVREQDAPSSKPFTATQRLVLTLTDRMTREIAVSEELFAAIRSAFTDAEVVELVATVAAYNMVSRFAVALDITVSDTEVSA